MSQDPAFFEALYAGNPDPWGFATSAYERDKYDATLAALPRPRARSALEIGCSIGVFTQRLAARCDRLLGLDVSERALAQARLRCANLPQVTLQRRAVPAEWPDGTFDLILLSEVLYFLDAADIVATAARAQASLEPGGCLILVNWLGETGTAIPGDPAADLFLRSLDRRLERRTTRRPSYRLDLVLA